MSRALLYLKMLLNSRVRKQESFFLSNAPQKPPDVKLSAIWLVVGFSDEMEMRENISSSPGSIVLKCTLMLVVEGG